MNTLNKRLKIGASFPGFYLIQIPHLARLSLLTPCQSLSTKNLPFPLCGQRVSPIQAASFHLQSGDGECLPATQLYLSVFTCPTASLNLPSDAGESLLARQPYLFHPTADLSFRLYLSNTASLDLPSDAGESLPARQLYLFEPVVQRGLPVRHGDLETTAGRRQEPLGQQPHLFLLDEAYPSDTATLKPVGCRREPTGQSNLSFPFCGRQSLPNHAAG